MKGSLIVFVTTLVLGILAMLIDANLGLDGNLSVVISIATVGAFLYHSNTKNR